MVYLSQPLPAREVISSNFWNLTGKFPNVSTPPGKGGHFKQDDGKGKKVPVKVSTPPGKGGHFKDSIRFQGNPIPMGLNPSRQGRSFQGIN